jgi:hypothetical protein
MAQMKKTPRGQSPLGPGRFIGTNEAEKAKEAKRIKEGKPTYSGKPKAKPSTVQQVAKRFGITAREARDIATAVGTVVGAVASPKVGNRPAAVKAAASNIKRQVKEVGTAATTGKKGTTSARILNTYGDDPYKVGGSRGRKK